MALALVVAVGIGFVAGMVIGNWYVARDERPAVEDAAWGTTLRAQPALPPAIRPPDARETPALPAAVTPPAPPPPPAQSQTMPAWRRYAVPTVAEPGVPMIAVVIDDMGVDRRRSDRISALPGPLTTSFLPYGRDLHEQTRAARARGHELMLHVPMEPLGRYEDPGPQVLEVGRSAEILRARLIHGLDQFPTFVGINNHMGSKFTADDQGMRVVMEELRTRGLLFLDSVTTNRSLGGELASSYGVPYAERDVFLDNDSDINLIRQQLAELEAVARKRGHAIAIGHPRDGTIAALAEWLPTLRARGFVLVPVSAIVQRRFPAG